MEAKSGEAGSPAPAPASAAPVSATAVPEATVSFQSPESVAPTAAAPATSAVEKIRSADLLVPPGYMTAVVAAGGGGFPAARPVMKVGKKRGRPRKYGPDGSLIRPLNATPISASVPMAASVAAGQYTPASAVGAAMKRGRGRPLDFAAAVSKPYQHHLQQHQPHQHQQQFGFHFGSIGLRNYEAGDWMPAADRPMA